MIIISNFKTFYDNLKKLSYISHSASKCTVSCSVPRNAEKGVHRYAKNQKKILFFGALRNVYVKGHPNEEVGIYPSNHSIYKVIGDKVPENIEQ